MEKEFSGRIFSHKPDNPKHNIRYMLTWNGKAAIVVLTFIKNMLLVKRKQAELLLSFPFSGSGHPLSTEESNLREQLYQEVKKLNARSINKTD